MLMCIRYNLFMNTKEHIIHFSDRVRVGKVTSGVSIVSDWRASWHRPLAL